MTGHGVRLGGDGRLVVVRTAPPEPSDRLRRTIQRLRNAAGAGAVDIVDVVDDGEHVELAVAFAGHALLGPIGADTLAPIAAALAGHLSDLHLRRVIHGAVSADHVLIDASGCVRLCGFGHELDAAAADDVHAFGTLVRSMLDPDERSVTADALRAHADRCTAEDPAMRPTMAALAASIAGIDLGGRSTPTRARDRSTHRWPLIAASALAVVVVAFAAPRASRASGQREAAVTSASVTSTVVTSTTVNTSVASTTTTHAARVWPRTIAGDGSTWNLGDADDEVLLGDWDGDGITTPALVERPSGHVWVVDRWPDGDAAPTRFVMTVAAPIDVDVVRIDGRDVLVVRTASGEIRPVLAPSA